MKKSIPNYTLYGDKTATPAWLDTVHIEQIHERSSLYDFSIAPHVHDGLIQVLYLTQGGGEVFIDNRHWSFLAPALIVVPSQHVHGFEFRRNADGPVVTAAQRPLESLAAVATPDLLAHIRQPRVLDVARSHRYAELLLPLFQAIERENRVHTGGEAAAGTALLMAVFVQISRIASSAVADEETSSGANGRKAAQVEQFRALIDAHFRERWSIDRYAQSMGLSAGQLSRLCREVLGASALDVVNTRVIHEAERELVYSTLGIKQIAGVLGFLDEAYFGRFFRKHTGMTPSEFREAARRRISPQETKR